MRSRKESSLAVIFLDVGQGDSIIILLPSAGHAILVDCPDTASNIVLEFLQKNRIRCLSLAMISHFHVDHCEGFANLLANFLKSGHVSFIALNPWIVVKEQKSNKIRRTLKRIRELADKTVIDCVYRPPERSLWKKEPRFFFNGVEIEILYPLPVDGMRSLERSKPNEGCVVSKVKFCGRTVLLTSDLSGDGFDKVIDILAKSGDKIEVIQVPHHGAWDDKLPTFLAKVSPTVAIISVGSNNRYDHPSPHTLEELRRLGIRVLCTQLTKQCHPNPLEIREEILSLMDPDNKCGLSQNNSQLCPCAGTIYVTITENGLFIKPEVNLHRNIIGRARNRSCM